MPLVNIARGGLSLSYLVMNTLLWCIMLYAITLARLVIPLKRWRKGCVRMAIRIAECWILFNNIGMALSRDIKFNLSGIENLDCRAWYLVISNHQSWVDIPVLQKAFYNRIPFLKFFIKKELIWVPLLGQAWWALDFPFLKRYSAEYLRKHPHLKGKDMEITRKACERFRDNPISIMNFSEGTRFSPDKQKKQNSPYMHLLKPKAGGIGMVLSAMDGMLSYVLDVTIFYPDGIPDLWDFLCGNVRRVDVYVKKIPLSEMPSGDYVNDESFKIKCREWLNSLWKEKDLFLERAGSGSAEN